MPKISEHPAVTKKRTNSCYRYYGVGIRKPEAVTESMRILEELQAKRAAQCRQHEQDMDNWDDLIFN